MLAKTCVAESSTFGASAARANQQNTATKAADIKSRFMGVLLAVIASIRARMDSSVISKPEQHCDLLTTPQILWQFNTEFAVSVKTMSEALPLRRTSGWRNASFPPAPSKAIGELESFKPQTIRKPFWAPKDITSYCRHSNLECKIREFISVSNLTK